VIVTNEVEIAQSFFCFSLQRHDPFLLDRPWICAPNKLLNQANGDLQEWRSQGAQLLGVISVLTERVKRLPNCLGFPESPQLDFIEG
jgi:hypothetical protein